MVWIGGVATVVVGQPLDTIKVKMQSFPKLYTNTINCFKQTIVKVWDPLHMFYSFFNCFFPVICRTGSEVCTRVRPQPWPPTSPKTLSYSVRMVSVRKPFYMFDRRRSAVLLITPAPVWPLIWFVSEEVFWCFFLIGFLAAFFSSFSLCPTELIKCKLQAIRETGASKMYASLSSIYVVLIVI